MVGQAVCHRGDATGFSCGVVADKAVRLNYTDACPGTVCAKVWVEVVPGDLNLRCANGDSGGPVGSNTTAYGFYKGQASAGPGGGQCESAYYMSVTYLVDLDSVVYLA